VRSVSVVLWHIVYMLSGSLGSGSGPVCRSAVPSPPLWEKGSLIGSARLRSSPQPPQITTALQADNLLLDLQLVDIESKLSAAHIHYYLIPYNAAYRTHLMYAL
jgi:hypothetical protein